MIQAIKTDQIVYFGRILNTRFRGLHVTSQNTLQISKIQHSNWIEHSGEKVKKKKPFLKVGEDFNYLVCPHQPASIAKRPRTSRSTTHCWSQLFTDAAVLATAKRHMNIII